MAIKDNKIDPQIVGKTGVTSIVEDTLTGTVEENKAVFDKLPAEIIKLFNEFIDYMDTNGYDDFPIAIDFKYIKLTSGKLEVSIDKQHWITIGGGSGTAGDISNEPILFHEDTTGVDLESGNTLSELWGKQLRINRETDRFKEFAESYFATDYIVEQKTTDDGWEYSKYINGTIVLDKTMDITVGTATSVNGVYRAKYDLDLGRYLNKITSITAGAQNSGVVLQPCVNGSNPSLAEFFAISIKSTSGLKFENVPIHVVGKWK